MLLAALQGQAAKPGLPVRPVRVPSTALWPRGWQLQPRLHSSTGTGRPMRRRCVAIPWDGAGRRAPGCASPVISPPRHAVLLWNRARQQREPGGAMHTACCLEPRCTHSTRVCRAACTRVWLWHSRASIAACSVPPLCAQPCVPVASVARTNMQVGRVFCVHTRVKGPLGHVWGGGRLQAVWVSAVGLGWERCGAGAGWRPPAGRGGGVRHSLRRLLFYLVQSQFLECF